MSTSAEKQVIDSLLQAGCGEFVLCGGARNASLIALLEAAEGLQIWKHFEERGAAFFALGRVKDTGRPCAIVTTSGTAVAECLPAVIEAHYTALPLIVVSADRPAHFRGSGAPQTIEQEDLFGDYAVKSLADWSGRIPVHLNLPLDETPIEAAAWTAEVEGFLPARLSFEVRSLRDFFGAGIFRGVIAMVGGLAVEDREDAYYFLKELGIPVIADITSGIREVLGDLAVPEGIFSKKLPGRVLRLGEVPLGRLWRDLEDHPEVEVLSICRNGLPGLARPSKVIHAEVGRVVRGLGAVSNLGDIRDDFPKARAAHARTDELLESFPDSEPGLVAQLSVYATIGESLFLGNSLPIREWNEFGQRETPFARVFANRGANGIDGQLSTWLGATAETPDSWGVFGDLTTLCDLAAPAFLPQVETKGRVLVVINNNGGRIFDRLPRLDSLTEAQRAAIVQPQEVSLKSWAEMWSMDYLAVTCREDFDNFEPGEKTLLLELIPDKAQTEAFWKAR